MLERIPNLGTLRHQAVIQHAVESRDGYGAVTLTWEEFGTRRCAVEPVMGATLFQGAVVRPGVTHGVVMRYLAGVTPRMRLLLNGTTVLAIDSVFNPDMVRRYLMLQCVEEVS